jgi:hypothetical protein
VEFRFMICEAIGVPLGDAESINGQLVESW